MMNFNILSLLVAFTLVSCSRGEFKESKTFAGAKVVSASTLNEGKNTYLEYCVQCHGYKGEGDGPAAKGMYPPPRNLTLGIYKFGEVVSGELPHDEDFYKIINHGLNGTAMLPWDLTGKRLEAVVHYIKTFAPKTWEGKDLTLGTKFELPKDPYGDTYREVAIEKGKKVYHITAACTQCHRGYESKEEISKYNIEINKVAISAGEFAADLYQLKPQDSEFGYKVIPPDFTYHPLRSISDVESIVKRLMYGVAGSGMPGWKDVVTDDELWALAYYIDSLRQVKENGTRAQYLSRIKE